MEPGRDPVVSPEGHTLPPPGSFPPEHRAARHPIEKPIDIEPPQLLWPLEPRLQVFARNLSDLLLMRGAPRVPITAHPAEFWSDVFVDQRVSTRALTDSALLHVLALLVVIGVTQAYMHWHEPELHDAFQHTQLTFYEVSEYLPEVHTTDAKVEAPRKPVREGLPKAPADPVYAKQEIISVPPDPDNLRQTIVTPSELRIHNDVPLPNIVTAHPPKAADVMEISNRAAPKLETPPEIVAPKLKIAMAPPEIANAAVPKAAEVITVSNAPGPKSLTPPEVDAPKLKIGMKMPEVATGSVPKAAPTPMQVANGRVRRDVASQEVAAPQLQGSVAAPVLSSAASAALPKPAPAPASTDAAKSSDSAKPIMALSTQPAPANGPLNIPNGSRRGVFAAGPEGHPDATAAPESSPEKNVAAGNSGAGPSGIHVSGGDAAPHSGVIASGAPRDPASSDSLRNKMSAMLGSANVPPPRVEPDARQDNDATAKAIFGEKRYYRLTVNMPNLASASGSWIIRFAELHPLVAQEKIPLSSPVPLRKADPAYPPDLIKDKVEGVVVLYAIIRSDGAITDVKILNSINDRLDQSAIAALHRWQFQPGSKDGKAVDVEAVVQVPFKVKRLIF